MNTDSSFSGMTSGGSVLAYVVEKLSDDVQIPASVYSMTSVVGMNSP